MSDHIEHECPTCRSYICSGCAPTPAESNPMTPDKTPTDAELKALLPTKKLARDEAPKVQVWLTQADALAFARAVLAKWGSPVVGEPVAMIEFTDGVKEPRIMCWDALPAGQHRVYTAPQPTHTQTGAVPLTAKQMESGRDAIFSTDNPYCPCDSKTFRKVAEWVERHHGITHKEGGQHAD